MKMVKKASSMTMRSHLKRIVALNLLADGASITFDEIDQIFEHHVWCLSDIDEVFDGKKIKAKLIQSFNNEPNLELFNDEDGAKKKLAAGWKDVFGGCVLHANLQLDNPLNDILLKMKIDYDLGGFFRVRRVRWSDEGKMFLDYEILIESVDNKLQLKVLHDLH